MLSVPSRPLYPLIGYAAMVDSVEVFTDEGAPPFLNPRRSKQKKLDPPGTGENAVPALGQGTESTRLALCSIHCSTDD
ncbi:hypothetical protein STEG23_000090 [Scotinomys teguina]